MVKSKGTSSPNVSAVVNKTGSGSGPSSWGYEAQEGSFPYSGNAVV